MKGGKFRDFITPNIIWILLLGFSFFGLIKYIDQRFAIIEGNLDSSSKNISVFEQGYKTKLNDLEGRISGNAYSLEQVIKKEQEKDQTLKAQFDAMSDKVTDLAKISSIDRELLKKYSKNYFLNEHYVPISLSNIDPKYLNASSVNSQIHSNVLPYLEAMLITANNELSLKVQSAYRSFGTQSILKSNYKVIYGEGTANRFSADQGYSEHQLGTTLDFTTGSLSGALVGFEKTAEYKWLLENAYRFGFVLSYPENNAYYKFEPWHWRFVGIPLATRLHDDNMYFYDMDQRVIDTYLGDIFD